MTCYNACGSACLGNALDFGVAEELPDNTEQMNTNLPGFPDPEITQLNIRFQQTCGIASEVTRTDSMPIKHERGEAGVF